MSKVILIVIYLGFNEGNSGIKLVELEDKSKHDLLYKFAENFEELFGKKISDGPEGYLELKYGSNLPKFELIHPAVLRFYEDVLNLDSTSGKPKFVNKIRSEFSSEDNDRLHSFEVHQEIQVPSEV
jgi:hypothetical protein